jgi:hypothetical protein
MRILIGVLFLAACSSDDGAAPPAAPTNLAVSNLVGGGHLTWADNSDNEDQFVIMRRTAAGATFDDIDMVPFNQTQYHDSSVAAGTTYVYKIAAINAAGETTSNEVMFAP